MLEGKNTSDTAGRSGWQRVSQVSSVSYDSCVAGRLREAILFETISYTLDGGDMSLEGKAGSDRNLTRPTTSLSTPGKPCQREPVEHAHAGWIRRSGLLR